MKVLVTGATGFIGSTVARQLVAAGHQIRVLVRNSSKLNALAGLSYEKADGDITDQAAVYNALDGCDAIIHCAGCVSLRLRDRELLYRTNVEGTQAVFSAALERRVKRAVYTSSISTIAISAKPTVFDENAVWDSAWTGNQYPITKRKAEDIALELVKKGLPLVILNPGSCQGPGDPYLTSTWYFRDYLAGNVPGVGAGGMGFCDVRDVAAAHVAALERGRIGERYILSSQNFAWPEVLTLAAEISGLKKPAVFPYALVWLTGAISQLASVFGEHKFETLNLPNVRYMNQYCYGDSQKAARELGYVARPFAETLRDTMADHLRRGLVEATTPQLVALKQEALQQGG